MLSELRYGSYANYSPRGKSELSNRSRGLCGRIKAGDTSLINLVPQFLTDNPACGLGEFFTPDTTLIPIPGSAPTLAGGLWTPRLIGERFLAMGHGRDLLPCLQRVSVVPKSAFAAKGERPTIETHYNSMRVTKELIHPTRITLIDDVLTKGRTAYASARRVLEAFPEAEIRVFAIFRTQGLIPDIVKIRDPSIGRIYLDFSGADVDRDP